MIEPEPVAAWATDCRDKYARKDRSNPNDRTYPGNHDSGFAGRLCMADGNLAWAAVVSDGAGGSMEGLKISALAIQAFVDAVRKSSLAELSDPTARDAWLRGWTKSLHAEAWERFQGGFATFCGAIILPPEADPDDRPPSRPEWKLVSFNVGDSQIWKVDGEGRCLGIVPDAPPNNANVEGHNPVRVVGRAPKGDFCLIDAEEFPLPAEGPCWILAGSDGFFSKKKGKDELAIFSSGDMRDVCLDPGVPFQELPARAIRRSLANAQKLNCASVMDNATVAMLGFRVPATDLANPATGGFGSSVRVSAPASAPAPAPAPAPRPRPASAPASVSAADEKPLRTRPAILAGIAGGALVAGLVLGRILAPSPDSAASAEPSTPQTSPSAAPAPVDRQGVPANGRCPICWKRYQNKEIGIEKTFHWADDPAFHPEGAGKSNRP